MGAPATPFRKKKKSLAKKKKKTGGWGHCPKNVLPRGVKKPGGGGTKIPFSIKRGRPRPGIQTTDGAERKNRGRGKSHRRWAPNFKGKEEKKFCPMTNNHPFFEGGWGKFFPAGGAGPVGKKFAYTQHCKGGNKRSPTHHHRLGHWEGGGGGGGGKDIGERVDPRHREEGQCGENKITRGTNCPVGGGTWVMC